jgi:uncharacterized membrane protein YadS
VAALLLAIWWTFKKKTVPTATTSGALEAAAEDQDRPNAAVIWERFPKFVLGFILVSILFSFFIPATTTKQVGGMLNALRTIWFSLAFVSIGLEARFTDLVKLNGGRPALAFVGAQVFNILWTLLWAYLLFDGRFFPVPDLK